MCMCVILTSVLPIAVARFLGLPPPPSPVVLPHDVHHVFNDVRAVHLVEGVHQTLHCGSILGVPHTKDVEGGASLLRGHVLDILVIESQHLTCRTDG